MTTGGQNGANFALARHSKGTPRRFKGYATAMTTRYLGFLLWALLALQTHAAPAPFDLAGPFLSVKISRGGLTLPAAEVPNLAAGDRLWIKADLPPTQSAHYLLVAAFLRGSTNPPPESWFFPCKTWTGKCAADGLTATVPEGAQQVLIFLAPQTGGDFKTLVSAVRGRPGAFVRSSQDLNQAALDRSRLERYLSTIRLLSAADPIKLALDAPLLARSLGIKVDEKCLDRLPALQAPCLMQGQESLILNDGHSTSIVEALTSGPGSDLAMEASYTPQLSYGYYSPYIASVLDIARIFESFGTAQYQYIPALTSQRGDQLALTLNTAPSFHNPMSVLVAALPAVEAAQLPPLHAVNPNEIYCARRPSLVLPVEGAPLVFATRFAHDMTLRLTGADGKSWDLSATADATQGGFVVDTTGLAAAMSADSVQGSLQGYWGFDAYHGPDFRFTNAHAETWQLTTGDPAALIVGREDTVHLRANSVGCVDRIMLDDPTGKAVKLDWKAVKPNEVEVKLPLQHAKPGELKLLVSQYGVTESQPVALQVYAEAGRSIPAVASVDAPRPRMSLIGKIVLPSVKPNNSTIQLTDHGALPQDASLVFSIRALAPAAFARDESIEVADADESSTTTLNLGNGGLTLESAQVAVATLNPAKAFNPSAFGPLKFRRNAKGESSEWQPLATLVRVPTLKDLICPATPELACKLSGTDLFLIEAIAGDAQFAHSVSVPDGFLGSALPVPQPTAGLLYIKLRDDPGAVNPTRLAVQQLPAAADDAGRADARRAALPVDARDTAEAP